ncbi:MAG: histidine--tRNA ligase [Devosia sp.]|nr:histidine--tRNA ligase [Devosia sp.]
MTDTKKLIEPRLPRGFEDRLPGEIAAVDQMLATIKRVFERYGFDPLETPLFEYTETLGKFLPDTDRPNEGVFSLQDDDEQWLSLRYDLTAPLARYFAQNYDRLPKPFRSYRQGLVFRNEKPGPGRFRQFMQFDADTVGAAGPEADAEMCMMMADTMDALGLAGKYVVKVNNRKFWDGALDALGVAHDRRLTVLRAVDKLDRVGIDGVTELLGKGRKDESGDFTIGAELDEAAIWVVTELLRANDFDVQMDDINYFSLALAADSRLSINAIFREGVEELRQISRLVVASNYKNDRIRIDYSVVRGLEYYTGPVFEIELTFEVKNEKGQPVVFGSVGGGGRYDGLVSRFRNEPVPATGFSIGVSRLAQALKLTGNLGAETPVGPVVVLVMDRDQTARYQAMVSELRSAGIRTEMYLGPSGMNAQMKYANRRNAPAVVIEGSHEREQDLVTIKDMIAGAEAAKAFTDHAEMKAARPAQFNAPRSGLVEAVKRVLATEGVK